MSAPSTFSQLLGLSDMNVDFNGISLNSTEMLIPAKATTDVDKICPDCGTLMHGLGRRKNLIRTWPIDPTRPICKVEISRLRFTCPNCGKTIAQSMPSCVDEHHRLTKIFAKKIGEMAIDRTFQSIQKEFRLNDATVKRVFKEQAESILGCFDFVLPTVMGIDEVMTEKNFRTTITNLDRRCLFDILEYRQQPFLEKSFLNYPLQQREAVKWVCSDMYRPFKKPIGQLLPNAKWVIDRFHVVMKANAAVDQMRIRLQAKLPNDAQLAVKKHYRFSLLRRPKNLRPHEHQLLALLRIACPELMIGYDLKENLYAIYEQCFTRSQALAKFNEWKKTVPDGKNFEEFQALIKTFENFQDNILNFFDSGGLTNALTECTNGLIKITNRLGRGYDFQTLRLKMLCRNQAVIDSMLGNVAYGPNISTVAQALKMDTTFDEDALMLKTINMNYEKRRQNLVDSDDVFSCQTFLEDELTNKL